MRDYDYTSSNFSDTRSLLEFIAETASDTATYFQNSLVPTGLRLVNLDQGSFSSSLHCSATVSDDLHITRWLSRYNNETVNLVISLFRACYFETFFNHLVTTS